MKPHKSIIHSSDGVTLIEVMVAFVLGAVILLGVLRSLSLSMSSSVNSREQLRAGRLAQTFQSRLTNMPFNNIVSTGIGSGLFCDSAMPDFGITNFNSYPSRTSLLALQDQVKSAGFTRFTVDVEYLRRDSSDMNTHQNVVQYVPVDLFDSGETVDIGFGAQKIFKDKFDPSITMVDANGDGDYFDSYTDANGPHLEAPDTHLKAITLQLWKKDKMLIEQRQVMSAEKFTGTSQSSAESPLKLYLTDPPQWEKIPEVRNTTIGPTTSGTFQKASIDLPTTNDYPSWVHPPVLSRNLIPNENLLIQGYTEAGATLQIWADAPWTGIPTNTPDVTYIVGPDGHFNFQSPEITEKILHDTMGLYRANRGEGWRKLAYNIVKNGVSSPFHYTSILLDINPPYFPEVYPTDGDIHVHTLCPAVYAVLKDTAVYYDSESSGIEQEILNMTYQIGSASPVTSWLSWDAPDKYAGKMWMQEQTNYLPPFFTTTGSGASTVYHPILHNGDTLTIKAEGGDQATYKTIKTWSFKIDVDLGDTSPPDILPMTYNPASNQLECKVNDDQSGVDPYSIVVQDIDAGGIILLQKNMPNKPIGLYFDGSTGIIHLPNTFPNDTHTIKVTVSNFSPASVPATWQGSVATH